MIEDAYRSSAFPCPVCANAVLRVFQDRLVCDECGGMQLATDEFGDSIREIDGSKEPLAITDHAPAAERCPQCREPMQQCALQIGAVAMTGEFLHCATHGLWVPRSAMTAAFARASRRVRIAGAGANSTARGFASGAGINSTAAAVANMPSAHGGMSSAMAGIASAFGGGSPASAGLAISHWEHYRPRAHTLFVSAHKDRTLSCPACFVALAYQGDRWACSSCSGLFVENEALVAMVREMALTAWDMPTTSGAEGKRPCPICKTAMIVELLEGVTIDRCADHGVFFDEHELEQTLHHAAAHPSGLGAWMKRLFGRTP